MSTNGGVQVRWRQDGKELFYIALNGRLMAVPVQLSADGGTVGAGAPAALFLTRVFAVQGINIRQQFICRPRTPSAFWSIRSRNLLSRRLQ